MYYGSTSQTLSQRMAGHRKGYKGYLAGKKTLVTSFELLAFPDAYIELVRVVEYNVKAELHAVECEYIRGNTCVNKVQPTRTQAQYYIDHVEEKAKYRLDHVEERAAYFAAHYITNGEKIRAQVAAYKAANAAKLHETHECECSGTFQSHNKARHLRSAKHQTWLAE